jgi:prolycopene isomerase
MMADYIEGGTYYCLGGFQKFISALVDGFTKHGGELLLGAPVTQIKKKNRFFEIDLNNSQRIVSHQLICNMDPRIIFNQLLAEPQVNHKYLQKLNAMKESCSTIGLFLATDIDVRELDAAKVTVISDWDLESTFSGAQHGEIMGAAVHIPSLVDPSLAPQGENVVIIQAFAPARKDHLTPESRSDITNQLLQIAEKILPGLRNHITFAVGSEGNVEDGTALHTIGPMYGWENSFNQTGPRRLSPITPINDLYLTGHWTQPGSGIWTVVLSGILAARIGLNKKLSYPIWPLD